ncbi:hypothetical protein I4F81_012704 [Pyropia yezoensis]|uniref:Uncharacterized protein n=1 Tax=Pyropia yezoensis TaxID=2788 RepID=A0ACC3CJ53_PYRYE|nr:hypothetical protein I4F81_012704 [Neopyropia yezoensis]
MRTALQASSAVRGHWVDLCGALERFLLKFGDVIVPGQAHDEAFGPGGSFGAAVHRLRTDPSHLLQDEAEKSKLIAWGFDWRLSLAAGVERLAHQRQRAGRVAGRVTLTALVAADKTAGMVSVAGGTMAMGAAPGGTAAAGAPPGNRREVAAPAPAAAADERVDAGPGAEVDVLPAMIDVKATSAACGAAATTDVTGGSAMVAAITGASIPAVPSSWPPSPRPPCPLPAGRGADDGGVAEPAACTLTPTG